ncbi:MAG: hypothetical protein ABJ314_18600, partial [Ilumatobacter sp.]|uniref:hypothetical protein n=1 Tax=Ilumatobacter sp. TaxID=1967498 RepID=UPI00329A438E
MVAGTVAATAVGAAVVDATVEASDLVAVVVVVGRTGTVVRGGRPTPSGSVVEDRASSALTL